MEGAWPTGFDPVLADCCIGVGAEGTENEGLNSAALALRTNGLADGFKEEAATLVDEAAATAGAAVGVGAAVEAGAATSTAFDP